MAALLTGCATVPSPEPSSRPSAVSTPNITAPPTTPATAAASTGPFVGDAGLADALGDLERDTGETADRPRYVDIEQVTATADGDELVLAMTLGAEPPPTRLSSVERLRFYFALDTTGDRRIDYLLGLENYSDGSFRDAIEYWTAGENASSSSTFEMSITGRQVVARVPLADVGFPTSVEFCAFAMSAEPGGGPVFVKDYAPDGFCEGDGLEPDRQMLKLT